jgi:hypothetical protein
MGAFSLLFCSKLLGSIHCHLFDFLAIKLLQVRIRGLEVSGEICIFAERQSEKSSNARVL